VSHSNKRIIGQVKDGRFIGGKPDETGNREHKGHREYVRLSMREKYARDIEQPYKHGQPNPGYIEAYGKQNAINEGLVEAPRYK
jgi:hypothetical protein